MSAATPMGTDRRLAAYLAQNGSDTRLTPRQTRRINQKANRVHGLEGRLPRERTARQIRWAGILATRAARKRGEIQ